MAENTTFDKQTLIFDEIEWKIKSPPSSIKPNIETKVTGKPAGLTTGGILEAVHPPYWEYTFKVNEISGLSLTNVLVRDSQSSGSTENVFQSIEFADLKVIFPEDTEVPFNLKRAFTNPSSKIEIAENGARRMGSKPPDSLFQRGIKLTLVDNVLSGSGNCVVKLELSVVFRGATNDIDPGGIPMGMKLWPQFAYTWENSQATSLATKRVVFFWGSVKLTTNNKMHTHHGPAPNANIASFYTDSNNGMRGNARGNILTGRPLRNTGGVLSGGPIGWGVLFDYIKPNVTKETFHIATIGGGAKHPVEDYIWPNPSDLDDTTISSAAIQLRKTDRQGHYDNIHVVASMPDPDVEGNIQIHAPFCGHSCIHIHWRWSSTAVSGATDGRGWQYKGWSSGPGARAHSTTDAPLVPPNQSIMVALCRPNATRFPDLLSPQPLDPLLKMIWYQVIILEPNAGQKQVAMEHGLGWAFRYSVFLECSTIALLYRLTRSIPLNVNDVLPPANPHLIALFFERDVYPFFRYIDGIADRNGRPINQIPNGDYTRTIDPSNRLEMEDV